MSALVNALMANNKSASAVYIEDVFSTYLYTGNGSTQTITNGIDLAGKGGLVWIKDRTALNINNVWDTARGPTYRLFTDGTNAQTVIANGVTSFNSNGFSIGAYSAANTSSDALVSWTFRKQPKFFDVVTYTGTGASQTISHNLGSVPGFMVVKATSTTSPWTTWHTSTGNARMYLNLTNASVADNGTIWGDGSTYIAPTSSNFTISGNSNCGASGVTYVIYLFASNAGGFGLTGTDNVISCGSFTTNGSGASSISLGYEPQYLLFKQSSGAGGNWYVIDNMRGMPVLTSGTGALGLNPNLSDAEVNYGIGYPTATGFTIPSSGGLTASQTYIYIAIRRGPMKVPTDATKVFAPVAAQTTDVAGFPVDAVILANRDRASYSNTFAYDRLRGGGVYLVTNITNAEQSAVAVTFDSNTQVTASWLGAVANVFWNFRRAPSFFDEVCFTNGAGTTTTNHNLGVAPELLIVKPRNTTGQWWVYSSALGTGFRLFLNLTNASAATTGWGTMTSTTFQTTDAILAQPFNYVAYLFATCAGVSKVGSYTGNGSTQTINCGFAGGARFVLIKRTDSTGDWYVWDTARGIVTGNDPHLSLNTTAAEVTTDDTIDPDSSGFIVNQLAATNVNVNAATYIYLAIA